MGLRLSLSDLPSLPGNKSLVDSLLVHMLLCDVPLQLLCRCLVQEIDKDDDVMLIILMMVRWLMVMVMDAWCSVNILSQKLQLAEVLESLSANFHTGDRRWTTGFSSL